MDSTFHGNILRLNGRKCWGDLTEDYKRKIRKLHNDNLLLGDCLSQETAENIDFPTICESLQSQELIVAAELEKINSDNSFNNENESINDNNVKINDNFIDVESSQDKEKNVYNVSFNEENFVENLAKCLVENNINQTQSRALLRVLRTHPYLLFLPKDPRALMKTSREKIITKIVSPGEYLHVGLEFKLQSIISRVPTEYVPNKLIIDFSTDGADLNKKVHIWPIQIRIINLPCYTNPEPVGIYQGPSKPNSFEEFFHDFIHEAESIIEKGGIKCNNKIIPIKFRCFIGDAPARASVLGHVSHISKNPCSKYKVEGITYKRSTRYPGINHPHRTDEEYRGLIDVDHHKNLSAIRKLPMNLVDQVPFDYMHLVCLGVLKKLVETVVFGKCQAIKLQKFEIDILSNRLTTLQNYCPREFARIPRELDKYHTFKATEFRQLLLYTFPIVSKGILQTDHYNNFLLLHASMRILLNDTSSIENVNFTDEALKKFVIDAENLYGLEFLSYNSHGLVHLVRDYKLYGSLYNISAFTYENSIRLSRSLVRKPNQLLQQIHKRSLERNNFEKDDIYDKNFNKFKAHEVHEHGPICDSLKDNSVQYVNLKTPTFFYSIHTTNNTIIDNDNRIGVIQNIICHNDEYFLAVRYFTTVKPFYEELDRPSTNFGVYLCISLQEIISIILICEVKTKCYRMPVWVKKTLTPYVNDEQLNNAYYVIEMIE